MILVKLSEREFLGDPSLWSSEGLSEWLRDRGIDPTLPYTRTEGEHEFIFVQVA